MGFQNVELMVIEHNPYRDDAAYIFDQEKIDSLAESIADTSFWENMLARKNKEGKIQLAYGHHRLMALKKLYAEGMTEFKVIKLNVRNERELTNERMLKIFVQENKDIYGEIPQNLCMSVLQLKAHLTSVLSASKDKDDFLKKIGDRGALKMDDRSFTRAKNTGVGATMISDFLGDTWSRQTIFDALQVIEDDEATFNLAQNLPNVTLANRFQKLVTVKPKTKKDEAEMAPEDVQRKVQDEILKHNLTRAEVEDAIKINKAGDSPDPEAAIKVVVEKKKATAKRAKEDAAADRPAPKEPVEKIQAKFDALIETIRKEKKNIWSKDDDMKTVKECLILLRDVINEPPPVEEVADADTADEMFSDEDAEATE